MYNKFFKNFLSLSAAEFISRASGFVISIFLARVFTVSEYGLLGFITALLSYFILFINFGYDTYGTRESASDISKAPLLLNKIFSQKIISSVIIFFLYLAIILYSIPDHQHLLFILFGMMLFAEALDINWFYRSFEKMDIIFYAKATESLIYLTGTISLVLIYESLYVIPLVFIFSRTAAFLYYNKKLPNNVSIKLLVNFHKIKNLFRANFTLGLTSLFALVYLNLDLIMLNYFKNDFDVGIYNAASKIFFIGILPLHLILASFFPRLSKMGISHESEFINLLKNYSASLIVTALISSAVIFFFSDLIVSIIFGSNYQLSSEPLIILALNILFVGLSITFGNPLIAWRKQGLHLTAIGTGAGINIIFNFLLIPKYSYMGAAYATLIAEIVVLSILLIFYFKIIKQF